MGTIVPDHGQHHMVLDARTYNCLHSVYVWFRDMVGLTFLHITQISHVIWIWKLSVVQFYKELARGTSESRVHTYRDFHLDPSCFAFLVKLRLEGELQCFAFLSRDPLIYLTSSWNTD